MAPIVTFAVDNPDDVINEFDQCTLCGHVTKLLIMTRCNDVLMSICGRCIDDLKKAYLVMLSKRVGLRPTSDVDHP